MQTSSKAYTAALPRKRMGAGCLFFDEQGRVLLVKPTYKPGWEIPGGVVELNESPKKCCRREVDEELTEDRFFMDETLPQEMVIALRRRVLAAMQQAAKHQAVYLDNQNAG